VPTVVGGRVRLNPKEKEMIEDLVGECINPTTADEFNAWVDLASIDQADDDPGRSLLRAAASALRIKRKSSDVNWSPVECKASGKVISVDFRKS